MTRMIHDFDGYLYRAVEEEWIEEILSQGILSDRPSYWGTHSIAAYYAETIKDDGKTPVILRAALSSFDLSFFQPDQPGIDEPLSYVIGSTDSQIYEDWCKTDGSWKSSLDLIGSIRYHGPLSGAEIMIEGEV